MSTATVRRLSQLFPRAKITFAVSSRYREAGELLTGLPYVDRLFVTELYFDKLTESLFHPWHLGWPVDLRGDDEVAEQRRHDLVLETRPRHRRMPWWQFDHQVAELAHMVGVPGPIDLIRAARCYVGIDSGLMWIAASLKVPTTTFPSAAAWLRRQRTISKDYFKGVRVRRQKPEESRD